LILTLGTGDSFATRIFGVDMTAVSDDAFINKFELVEGRLPHNHAECLIEVPSSYRFQHEIGESFTVSGENDGFENIADTLNTTGFTVVGIVKSPLFMSIESEPTTIGSGSIALAMYVPESAFSLGVYTDIFMTLHGAAALNTFGDAYEKLLSETKDELSVLGTERSQIRYNDVIGEAAEKLDEAQAEYDKAKADAQSELDDARKKLDDAKAEYDDGVKKLSDAQAEIADGKKALADAENEISQRRSQLAAAESEYESGRAAYDAAIAQLGGVIPPSMEQTFAAQKARLDAAYTEITSGKAAISDAEKEIAVKNAELADAEKTLAENRMKLEDADAEIAAGESEYADGVAEMNVKLSEAQEKINDARADAAKIEIPEWIIFTRADNVAYTSYKSNVEKVDAIAKVFPVFFFLVAALVALTTMTRMVEEERLQIGTLRALGYSKGAVMFYYIAYSLLASAAGGAAGVSLGFKLLPTVIANAYTMMYTLPKTLTPFRPLYAVVIIVVAAATTTIATWWSCRTAMSERPAALMQSRAPKAGKRILLERMGFIWKRLGFIQKVTARNLFRYKKRFFMTVIGIAGCCALLVTGFGLRDSISDIVELQFGQIYNYNLNITVDDKTASENGELNAFLSDKNNIGRWARFSSQSGYVSDKAVTIYTSPDDAVNEFFTLRDRVTKQPVVLGGSGAVLTEKLCETLGISVGDTFTLENADGKTAEFECIGVTENYVAAFCYMTWDAYNAAFESEPEVTTVLCESTAATDEERDAQTSALLALDGVTYAYFSDTIRSSFVNMLKNINYIVMVLIISAGALAVIVLYNLININICERRKEIATIKVLGFYDGETAAYIYRETLLLCVIGTIFGLLFGIVLHQFVIRTAEVDAVMFGRAIKPLSYVISALMTMVFACIVNLMMFGKIKRIDMVESMKAPE
ncbi:MAG: FtsX-like permease family protein, partial [Eubacteriales bacterium]